jgi:hypothetical protein
MIRRMPIAACLLLIPFPALASQEDFQSWQTLVVTTDVSPKVVVSLDTVFRWTDNSSRLGQLVIRPAIGYRLGKNTTVTIGYSYFNTDPVGPRVTYEHRPWQQLSYRLAGDGKGVTLTGRSRLEQRRFEGSSGTGWRVRQQLRLTAPISKKVRGVVTSEAFIALNDTSWGQNSGLDRWRNFVGVSFPLNKTIILEPGYLNQAIFRSGEDTVHHVANMTVTAKF